MFNYRGKYSLTNKYAKNMEDYGEFILKFCIIWYSWFFYKVELILGISHADEVSYIFKIFENTPLETESDAAMVNYITAVIGKFMKTG